MLKRISTLIFILLFVFCGTVSCFAETMTANINHTARGMIVKTGSGGDFPSAIGLSTKEQKQELSDIVEYAASAGYDTLYFEIRPDGAALYKSKVFPISEYTAGEQGSFTLFDPLKYLIKLAKKSDISVCAVIDPYFLGNDSSILSDSHPAKKNPELLQECDGAYRLSPESEETITLNSNDLKTILAKYKQLSGVALMGLDNVPQDDAEKMLSALSDVCKTEYQFGAFLSENSPLLNSDTLDFTFISFDGKTGFADNNFSLALSDAIENTHCTIISIIDTEKDGITAAEACAEIMISENLSIGTVVGSYRALHDDDNFAGSLIASMQNESDTVVTSADYSPAQMLTITRPTSKITTTDPAYFIMGTSNPDELLYFEDEKLDRQTTDGVFGVLAELSIGTNVFTFRQDDNTATVTIVRSNGSSYQSGSVATTEKITSMFPRSNTIAANDEELSISCVAPANTRVTATLGDETVTLEQAAIASDGIPATFRGKIIVNGAKSGQVLDMGAVTYRIETYGTEFTSAGHVYVTGDGAVPYVRINTTSASVFYDSDAQAGNFKAIYKEGVIDRVLSVSGDYYEISSGYIKKSDADVLTDDAPEEIAVTAITTDHDEHAERFVLQGASGLPYTFVDNDDKSIDLTLYGVSLPDEIDTTSELFSEITWTQNDNSTINVHLVPKNKNGAWAVDVLPSDDGTIIYARRAPQLSATVGKPLEGVSIVLDPGHGGNDSGALDTLGGYESDLNLANATELKYRLEQLGAEVTLTRTSADDTKSLYERVEVGQTVLPDFFIALHHNSTVTYADGYKHSGVEAYYYEDFGKALAKNVVSAIANADYDRAERTASWGYYIVAKNRFAPSILCEIGFVPNPIENRYIHDKTEIYKTANAFCTAILKTIADYNAISE